MPVNIMRNGRRYRQICLASTGRPKSKHQFVIEQRLNIRFLRRRARLNNPLAGANFDLILFEHFDLINVARGVKHLTWHSNRGVHIAGLQRAALFKPRIYRPQNSGGMLALLFITKQRQPIATMGNFHPRCRFDFLKV